MLPVILHPNARADLLEWLGKDRANALEVAALLEEMEQSEDVQDTMFLHDDEFDDINCKQLVWHQRQGRNVWRLRRHEHCRRYRIIYGYQAAIAGQKPKFVILAIAHKDHYNYEPEHPLTERIVNDYEDSVF